MSSKNHKDEQLQLPRGTNKLPKHNSLKITRLQGP